MLYCHNIQIGGEKKKDRFFNKLRRFTQLSLRYRYHWALDNEMLQEFIFLNLDLQELPEQQANTFINFISERPFFSVEDSYHFINMCLFSKCLETEFLYITDCFTLNRSMNWMWELSFEIIKQSFFKQQFLKRKMNVDDQDSWKIHSHWYKPW